MKLFARKPKPPLEEAVRKAEEALEIAYTYLRDRRYVPSREDLYQVHMLAHTFWGHYTTAQYIARQLRERVKDGKE